MESNDTEIRITVGRLAEKLAEAMADGLVMGRKQAAALVEEAVKAERARAVDYLAGEACKRVGDGNAALTLAYHAIRDGEHLR